MKITATVACLFQLVALAQGNGNNNGNKNGKKNEGNRFKLRHCQTTKGKDIERCEIEEFAKMDQDVLDIDVDGVSIRFRRFGKNPDSIGTALAFDGGNARAKKWHGECEGGTICEANFVTSTDADGTENVFGSLVTPDRMCKFGRNGDGTKVSVCQPPLELEGLDPVDEDEDDSLRNLYEDAVPLGSPLVRNNTAHRNLMYDDSGSNLDVMVVWTKEAECVESSLPSNCAVTDTTYANMKGLVDLAVYETNVAFDLSGIHTQLRLVHAYRHPTYQEKSDGLLRFTAGLSELRGTSDQYLNDVHTKRTLYGADIVSMIVSGGAYCGVAYPGPGINRMFSVVHRNCATGYYSFGHEIVHNLGAQHDRGTKNQCSNGGFNYGYRDPSANFRSILAYGCTTGQCDGNPGGNCPRVQRFSNVEFDYQGQPIGDNANNNALQINNVLATVAAYYPAVYCVNDNQCDDGDSETFDACDLGNNACVYSYDPIAPTSGPPSPSPTNAPTSPPVTSMPTSDFSGYDTFMQTFVVSNVDSSAWATVDLGISFLSPIIVCSVKYDGGASLNPALVRVRNVSPVSFQIRLQNPSGDTVSGRSVSCVAIEEGVWQFPDGRKIEAASYMSSVTDHVNSWLGEAQTYQQSYANPAVLGQVMTFNDPNWSVFWACGTGGRQTRPDAAGVRTGKHVGGDNVVSRAAELIGYIVMESGVRGTFGGIANEAGQGPVIARGYVQGDYVYDFSTSFSQPPEVLIVSQAQMGGSDGSWAVQTSDPTATSFGVAVDEDQISDWERDHWIESIDFLAFTQAGILPLVSNVGPTPSPTSLPSSLPSFSPTTPTATSSPVTPSPTIDISGLNGAASLESVVVSFVSSSQWTDVTLSGSYVEPVPVCTVKYGSGPNLNAAVVRMRNVDATGFQISLQSPTFLPIEGREVHCLVVEEGSWMLPDGTHIEAQRYLSTITDRKNSWVGTQQTLLNSYTSPAILGQVMTSNEPAWSVFWCRGATRNDRVDASNVLFTGKHTAEDFSSRDSETVGFVVVEADLHKWFGNMAIEVGRGPLTALPYVDGGSTYTFNKPFLATPEVAVLSSSLMVGNDGGWPILMPGSTKSLLAVALDEDSVTDAERTHIPEAFDYVVFSGQGVIPLLSSSPDDMPTVAPSVKPSSLPSHLPSKAPSNSPTSQPTFDPSSTPSMAPTGSPSFAASAWPSQEPSVVLTGSPVTNSPETKPSSMPSVTPSMSPSVVASFRPSSLPSKMPSHFPSKAPSMPPVTGQPTSDPSSTPSMAPSASPSATASARPSQKPSTNPTIAPVTPTSKPSPTPSGTPSLPPTVAQSDQPSPLPSITPSAPPTKVATGTPTKLPSGTPSFSPTTAIPTTGPSVTPTELPSDAPSAIPTSLNPTTKPTQTLSETPTEGPTSMPTQAIITESPSSSPSNPPTAMPTVPAVAYAESFVVNNVDSSTWTTVTLTPGAFVFPVPVCSVQYEEITTTADAIPAAVVRMRNSYSVSFQISLQNPQDDTVPPRTVHCLVVEEGAWQFPDGRLIEAYRYISTVTDILNSWVGETQSISNSYISPAVLGQVMTSNNQQWSVFWSMGATRDLQCGTNNVYKVGKHVGQYWQQRQRDSETVGYIVMETSLGHTMLGSVELEAGRMGPSINGFVNTPATHNYDFVAAFSNTPEVTVVSQSRMFGNDGSWAVLTSGTTSSTQLGVAVDEDSLFDAERWHAAETIDYVAISDQGLIPLLAVDAE